jgi:hypothetical protein
LLAPRRQDADHRGDVGALGSGDGDRATARHCDQFGDHVAADLLFYLMSAMSTVNANTTTPSIKTISSFIEEGSMLGMALEQQSRLRTGIETVISIQRVKQETIRSRNRTLKVKLAMPSV